MAGLPRKSIIRKAARRALARDGSGRTLARDAAGRELEAQLRESEQRFRATFEQAAVGIFHADLNGRYVRVNRKFCEITGYTEEEMTGPLRPNLSHPEDIDSGNVERKRLLSGEIASHSNEKRYVRKDGQVIWVNRTESLARDVSSKPLYFIRVIEDITDRKRTEARLERLTRARRVMAECNHILVHATGETGMLESMCRVVVESGGYKMAWVGLATGDPMRPVYPAAHAGFGDDLPMGGNAAWSADGRYRGFMSEVMASGEPHIARNILQDPTHAMRLARAMQRGFQSSIALPLRGDGRILGAIAMYAAEPDAFDAEEIALLKELADDIAFGIVGLRERVARRSAEAALQESEQQLRATFEQAAVGIARVDLDGVLVESNQKFSDMLGYRKDELLGKHIRDITHPDDYGRGAQYRAELTHRAMKSAAGEKRFIRKDGTVLWARRTMSTACDADNKPLYVISVVEDITERKMLERRFELAFNQAAVGMTQSSLDGRLIQVNQKYADMLGYGRDELRGMLIEDLTHPEDRAEAAQMMQKLRAREIESASSEKRLLRKDGRVIWVNRSSSLVQDVSGEPLHFLAVIEDITEHKRVAEAEAREHTLLRTVIDNMPQHVHVKDSAGRYLLINKADQQWRGAHSMEEVLGRTTAEFHDSDAARKFLAFDQEVLRTGKPMLDWEQLLTNAAGEAGWFLTSKIPLPGPDRRPVAVVTINRDITERKEIETERAQLAAIVESSDDAIISTTLDRKVLTWNAAAESMFGYTAAEVMGQVVSFLIPPDREAEATERRKLLDPERPVAAYDTVRIAKDGRRLDVSVTQSPIKDSSGRLIGVSLVFRNIVERKLSERRREMEHTVTAVLAESQTLEAAMPRLIRVMCEAMGWAYGARWNWSETEQTLVRSEYWSDFVMDIADEEAVPWTKLRVRNPGGLVSRAWFEKRPTWVEDMQRNDSLNRRHTALKLGLHSAFTFPIVAGSDIIGIMEFFGREVRQPDELLLQVAGSIGSQVGQFIQRKAAERALRTSEERYRDLFELSPLPMWVWDDERLTFLEVNEAAINHYGYTREEFLRMKVRDIWAPGEETQYDESLQDRSREQTLHLQRKHCTRDGRVIDVDVTARRFTVSGHQVWLTLINDITDRKRAEEQLMHLAHFDVLTNLPNRVLFYDRLKQALAQAKRNQWITGVMFIDLDRFKNVNDTLGHTVGDRLLQQVSERLTRSVRADDTVGRLGGDEFAIVLANLSNAQDANLVAQKIMMAFNEPFGFEDSEIYVTASIGITLYPEDGTEHEILIKNADTAMYRAKETGRSNYQFFTTEMNLRAQELLGMDSSLRRALERNEFLLHYQPKVSVAEGGIVGVEALLRWLNPERGLVPPAVFIPVLEETGFIVPVGEWVIATACAQIKAWERAGIKPVPVAVNLSARQFTARDLGPTIKRILDKHQVDPALLEMEITESSLMMNTEEAVHTLRYLKDLGIGLSIDDFGTGYSSLGYLKRFPLDSLKIDRSFVRDITTDADDASITRAVIMMAHNLGLKVIAEGVETELQLAYLAEHGCDQVQGYLFSRPLSAEAVGDGLREERRLLRAAGTTDSGAPIVLLVDDDVDALTLLKRPLIRGGYQVFTACNARDALELLGKYPVDAVISDQGMPGIAGVEFLRRAKLLFPKTVRMMISGYADPKMVSDAANKSGIFRFLTKDMSEEQLLADVRDAVQTRAHYAQENSPTAPGVVGK